MRKKNLYLLSPSDRFNYGDMLFPYILEHYLGGSVDEVVNCSTSTSDLSMLGGKPTLGFKNLYETDRAADNYLIVAGGESLFSPWPVILSFVYEDMQRMVKRLNFMKGKTGLNRLMEIVLDYYVHKNYGIKTAYPFTIGKHELPNMKSIMYNSVGNAILPSCKRIINSKKCKEILQQADYVSVRDKKTSEGLTQMGIEHSLYPDSAILMSEVFNDDYLNAHKSIKLDLPQRYIFFQINQANAHDHEDEYAKLLSRLSNRHGLKIVLCPIGTALGHSDDKALKKISIMMESNTSILVDQPNMWDIMYLIKNADLYVGTSLHGAITSMSFSTPIVSHSSEKVKQYLKQWGGLKILTV